MAKQIKQYQDVVKEATEPSIEVAQAQETEVTANHDSTKEVTKKIELPKQEIEIPAKADMLLQMYKDMEYAYIDAGGGIFTINTPDNVRGKAILYKNPYYKR